MENDSLSQSILTTTSKKGLSNYALIIIVGVAIISIGLITYISLQKKYTNNQFNQSGDEYAAYYENIATNDKAYYERLEGREPTLMQAQVVADIKNGIKTPLTQSYIYFITHRYFDTNGNIYELYDYIQRHKELAFLNEEGAKIYPDLFKNLEERKLPSYFNDDSTYIFAAYIEVLHTYGYANVAALATVANQYASSAFARLVQTRTLPPTSESVKGTLLKNNERDIQKAKQFLSYADSQVKDIVEGKAPEALLPRDRLVGVNQYAATLRYLEALSSKATSSKNADELFTFSMEYSRTVVPELHYFTSLLNGSTLAILPKVDEEKVTQALLPLINFDPKSETSYRGGVFAKILTSKNQQVATTSLRRADIYSLWNTVTLAYASKDFRAWLLNNGWKETDFR